MSVAALVLGAGRGERLRASRAGAPAGGSGEAPSFKAFVPLAGRSLLARSVAALAAVPEIETIVPVLPAEAIADDEALRALRAELGPCPALAGPVAGGAERQDSVRCGLAALPPEAELVAVHDAARPLVRPDDVARAVAAARAHGAALLVGPVADTIKRVREGRVLETPPRAECRAAQTPQVFRVDWLREALERAGAEGFVGTDDASLVERLGRPVRAVEGDPENRKITTAADLAHAEARLRARAEAAA